MYTHTHAYVCVYIWIDRGNIALTTIIIWICLIDSKFEHLCIYWQGFPDSSVGKESTCNAGDPGSIPGLGRSAGEGIRCPFQYSWASLMAQLVKNSPSMQETWVRCLGWEDPLEKGKAAHASILASIYCLSCVPPFINCLLVSFAHL